MHENSQIGMFLAFVSYVITTVAMRVGLFNAADYYYYFAAFVAQRSRLWRQKSVLHDCLIGAFFRANTCALRQVKVCSCILEVHVLTSNAGALGDRVKTPVNIARRHGLCVQAPHGWCPQANPCSISSTSCWKTQTMP